MQQKLDQMMAIVQRDPAVAERRRLHRQAAAVPAGRRTQASVFVALKPSRQRGNIDAGDGAGCGASCRHVPGARLFLQPVQDIRVGGRQSNAAYQYTLQADSAAQLYNWSPKLLAALQNNPVLRDVNTDQQQKGLETDLIIDRRPPARLGITTSQIDNTLYDAFGQRQVSTIYNALNQYHVVMEVAPQFWQSPETLKDIYVSTSGGNASGTESTNAVVGTVQSGGATTQHSGRLQRRHRQQFGAQRGDQFARRMSARAVRPPARQ